MNESKGKSNITTDKAYDILSHKRRRYAIHHLKQVNEPVSVRDLAEQVAAWENKKSIEQLDAQERKRVYVSLYQSHLETLDKKDIIEYDNQRGVVELNDYVEESELYMEVVSDSNIPWSLFYLGLSAAFSLTLLLIWFNISFFSQVSTITISAVAAGTYAVAALVQTYQQRRSKLGDDGPPPEMG